MRIAIKYEGLDISPSGRVAGHEAGDTLVRRLLRIFPGSTMIAPVPRHSEDLDVVPLEMLDPTALVVITRPTPPTSGRSSPAGRDRRRARRRSRRS